MTVVVSGIRLPVNAPEEEAFLAAKQILRRAGMLPREGEYAVYRRSVDARRGAVSFVYSVAVSGGFSPRALARLPLPSIAPILAEEPRIAPGKLPMEARPLVVGAGPAGLFCAYLLAREGYRPLLIERGDGVEDRVAAVERFSKTGRLDPESNVQFGAGGAGTFSDGKLVSRINDPLTGWFLRLLVEAGAPEDVITKAKPHVGTDVLRRVVTNLIHRIEELGGTVRFRTPLSDLRLRGDRVVSVTAGGEEIPVSCLVLALGNAARDTFRMLLSRGIAVEAKPISVGMRIEHLREEIDTALYGRFAGDPRLGAAEYHLSYDTHGRGVYTFCMCPGGVVVPAASEEGGVVVNGMSYRKRDGRNSNSAVVCSVSAEDFGNDPLRGMEFQRAIEERAYAAGGGGFCAPITTVGDFLEGKRGTRPTLVTPTYRDGEGVTLASPDDYLPPFVAERIAPALREFGKKIRGFDAPYAVLTGAETRTSSPIRLLRGEDRRAFGLCNLYPCGEGAGYAGGITSAAIDGIRTAVGIISVYKPLSL